MAKIHDKYVIELAEVIKGYGNDPDVEDPFRLSEFYRFYELPNIAVSRENFEKMKPLADEREYTEDDIRNAFNEGFALGQEYRNNVTLYGYDMNELVGFAIACRTCGITDADLKQFVTNIDFAFESIQNSLKEEMDGCRFLSKGR